MHEEKKDRYIYIAFFGTPTGMGQFIRTVTGHRYNHVSLSLYRDLRMLYSFARHHENTPFYGGFIKESLRRYPRAEQTRVKVCRLRLTAEQYDALCDFLTPFLLRPKSYVYNLLSAATSVLNQRTRLSQSYTCVEFVADALLYCGYLQEVGEYCTIKELERTLRREVIYEGSVKRYPLPKSWGGDQFAQRKGTVEGLQHTFFNIVRLYFMFRKERWHK